MKSIVFGFCDGVAFDSSITCRGSNIPEWQSLAFFMGLAVKCVLIHAGTCDRSANSQERDSEICGVSVHDDDLVVSWADGRQESVYDLAFLDGYGIECGLENSGGGEGFGGVRCSPLRSDDDINL